MSGGPRLLLATANRGKVQEFADLLADLALDLRSLSDFPDMPAVAETADSYRDNARLKARAAAAHCQLPALADDSGLEVDSLDRAPGVRSARFAADAGAGRGDADNVVYLLRCLDGVPAPRRTARFRCVIVVATPDGGELVSEGTCSGHITEWPRGANGFGYDPLFIPDRHATTFAEMTNEEKSAISHRAAACAALRRELLHFLQPPPS